MCKRIAVYTENAETHHTIVRRRTQVDLYTKVVLTVIAVALIILTIQPYTVSRASSAYDVVDVRIRGIDEASNLRWEPIKVVCDNCR